MVEMRICNCHHAFMKRILLLIATLSATFAASLPLSANAQPTEQTVEERRVITLTPLAGTVQPLLLSGWNVELDARIGSVVVGYSHGWSLEIPTTGAAKDQELRIDVPYSTGFGVGYEHASGLSFRLEPKLHRFEISDSGGSGAAQKIADYRTVTLGLGLYYGWRPFSARSDWTKGLTLSASVRYWPNVWSSLDGDEIRYQSATTGQEEVHRTANIGVANTPWVGNLSLGYAFDLGR